MKGRKNMITTQTVLEHLAGGEIVDALIQTMAEHFEDFSEAKERYEEAIRILKRGLPKDAVASVEDEEAAIRRQTASNLLFSGSLGLKANLDNFIDPIARNFLDVDSETYLRESTSHRLPEYEEAQKLRNRFYDSLSPAQKKVYEDVTAYVSHLENTGPKLAHYYGYLLGNDLLPRIVPGYHPDEVLTIQYRMMMRDYFGDAVLQISAVS